MCTSMWSVSNCLLWWRAFSLPKAPTVCSCTVTSRKEKIQWQHISMNSVMKLGFWSCCSNCKFFKNTNVFVWAQSSLWGRARGCTMQDLGNTEVQSCDLFVGQELPNTEHCVCWSNYLTLRHELIMDHSLLDQHELDLWIPEDPSLVSCDDQGTLHLLDKHWPGSFWSSNKSLGTILVHTFCNPNFCTKMVFTDSLFSLSSSDWKIICTINLWSLHTSWFTGANNLSHLHRGRTCRSSCTSMLEALVPLEHSWPLNRIFSISLSEKLETLVWVLP